MVDLCSEKNAPNSHLGPRVRPLLVVKDMSDIFVKLWISFLNVSPVWRSAFGWCVVTSVMNSPSSSLWISSLRVGCSPLPTTTSSVSSPFSLLRVILTPQTRTCWEKSHHLSSNLTLPLRLGKNAHLLARPSALWWRWQPYLCPIQTTQTYLRNINSIWVNDVVVLCFPASCTFIAIHWSWVTGLPCHKTEWKFMKSWRLWVFTLYSSNVSILRTFGPANQALNTKTNLGPGLKFCLEP